MPALSASGDTWGISDPQFRWIYLGLLVIGTLLAIYLRRSGSGPDRADRLPTPSEAALLAEGPDRAVYAAVAGLRAAGAIGPGPGGRLACTGPLPPDASRLDGAVFEAARRGVPVRALWSDPLVASALIEVRASAANAGWLLDAAGRRRARLGGLSLLGLALLGFLRIAAGAVNQRPAGFTLFLTLLTLMLAVAFLISVPPTSRAGRAALAQLRSRNAHLYPRQSPAWATYGSTGAALGVAIYGTAAIWAADPSFADATGLPGPSDSGSTSTGGDGGWGDGGGGGGGGCGGGGGGGG